MAISAPRLECRLAGVRPHRLCSLNLAIELLDTRRLDLNLKRIRNVTGSMLEEASDAHFDPWRHIGRNALHEC